MAQFRPGPARRIAAAVSGGADSLALAVLTAEWQQIRGGSVLALVVDHGLRPESAGEAALTLARLQALGIEGRLLRLEGLTPGSALASRARQARYSALTAACLTEGIVDLLLGHHRQDQAETVWMRQQAASLPDGLAGMASVREMADIRLLRPLLTIDKERLRETLRQRDVPWVEDPSNSNPHAGRTQARQHVLREPAFADALLRLATQSAADRRVHEDAAAEELAAVVTFRPEGFALIQGATLTVAALAALIQSVGGGRYKPRQARMAGLAGALRPATLAGVRIMRAGRLPGDWLIMREAASMERPVPGRHLAVWDRRFRVHDPGQLREAGRLSLGALAADAARFRSRTGLPVAILETLPAWRRGQDLVGVPHLGVVRGNPPPAVLPCPAQAAAGASFEAAIP